MGISRFYVSIAAAEVVNRYFSSNDSLEKILKEVMKKYECKRTVQNTDS